MPVGGPRSSRPFLENCRSKKLAKKTIKKPNVMFSADTYVFGLSLVDGGQEDDYMYEDQREGSGEAGETA